MAGLLTEARDAARTARAMGEKALDPAAVSSLTSRYRAIAGTGLAANIYRRTATAGDAHRIARRFIRHEDMILRFITRPDLDIFTNDLASYCTFCGGWEVRGLAGRPGGCRAGGFSVAGGSDILPWRAGAPGFAVGVAAA
jgi:hypothetical protein